MNVKILNRFFGTFFYVGMTPMAPGTVASIVAGILWFYVPNIVYLQVGIVIITLSVGLYLSMNIFNSKADKDPSIFVLDEIVGMWISLLMLPKHLGIYVFAFLLFRFFDILKPSIISHIDRSSNYYSIMLDDVCAGIFTLIICCQIVTI